MDVSAAVCFPANTAGSQVPLEDQMGQGERDPGRSSVAVPTLVQHAARALNSNLVGACALARLLSQNCSCLLHLDLASLHLMAWLLKCRLMSQGL